MFLQYLFCLSRNSFVMTSHSKLFWLLYMSYKNFIYLSFIYISLRFIGMSVPRYLQLCFIHLNGEVDLICSTSSDSTVMGYISDLLLFYSKMCWVTIFPLRDPFIAMYFPSLSFECPVPGIALINLSV